MMLDPTTRKHLDDIGSRISANSAALRAVGQPQTDDVADLIDTLWKIAHVYVINHAAEAWVVRQREKEIDLVRQENRDLRKRALAAEGKLLEANANLERMREIAVRYRGKLGEKA